MEAPVGCKKKSPSMTVDNIPVRGASPESKSRSGSAVFKILSIDEVGVLDHHHLVDKRASVAKASFGAGRCVVDTWLAASAGRTGPCFQGVGVSCPRVSEWFSFVVAPDVRAPVEGSPKSRKLKPSKLVGGMRCVAPK